MEYTQRNVSVHVVGLSITILLHVIVIWALKTGLARALVEVMKNPLETSLIEEMQEIEEEPPPPPPPDLDEPPPPVAIMPELAIAAPVEGSSTITVSKEPPKKTAPPAPKAAPVVVLPSSDGKRGITQPAYPPTSRRLGEQGSVELKLSVLGDGKVGSCGIATSSGFPRLDEAACKEAMRRWRLKPGTVDGVPTAMEYRIKVTFRIEEGR
jgi:protein TonB